MGVSGVFPPVAVGLLSIPLGWSFLYLTWASSASNQRESYLNLCNLPLVRYALHGGNEAAPLCLEEIVSTFWTTPPFASLSLDITSSVIQFPRAALLSFNCHFPVAISNLSHNLSYQINTLVNSFLCFLVSAFGSTP